MRHPFADRRLFAPAAFLVLGAAALLNGCADPGAQPPGMEAGIPGATRPATIRSDQLTGRWGVAAYHQETARARTEAAAKQGCRQPYVIQRGPTGGVIMHMADNAEPQELVLKGGTTGKNYVGPEGELTTNDREVVLVGTDMMTMKYLDPEIVSRYGTMVYVRCPDGPAPKAAKPKPKPKPKPAA
jgi:hypothetical protein